MADSPLPKLLADIRACTHCAVHLPLGPRPIVQAASSARLMIIGQAPGSRVHASGMPWDDASGDRLRSWTGLDREIFYDPAQVAQMPMGFCYPGAAAGGDRPPRRECAPLWHPVLLEALPRLRLTLLVGHHAQARYLPQRPNPTMTETVRTCRSFLPRYFPLPHPSWRSTLWMRRNPWFEAELVPVLRAVVRQALDSR